MKNQNVKHYLPVDPGKCTYYENVKSKQGRPIQIEDFLRQIAGQEWRAKVETYRDLLKENRLQEAAAIKGNLPAATLAVYCEGSHSKECAQSFSGFGMVDLDDLKGKHEAVKDALSKLPYMFAVWISVSDGIKGLVPVEVDNMEDYEFRFYPAMAIELTKLLNHPVDWACKDISRACFGSYDPHLFIQKDAPPFNWDAWKQVRLSVAKLLADFLRKHPFLRGERHSLMLKLGNELGAKRVHPDEVEELIELACKALQDNDFEAKEIEETIRKGYQYVCEHRAPERVNVSMCHTNAPTSDEDREERLANNREVRMQTPFLPEKVFQNLPKVLQEILTLADSDREGNILLLASLGIISGCLPRTHFIYGRRRYAPHFYFICSAPSASGKGVMNWAAKLAYPIQEEMDVENEGKQKEFEEAWENWEMEKEAARKEKRKANKDLKPEPVKERILLMPASTSKSKLLIRIAENPDGLVIFTQEADTLFNASTSECGHFDDLLRMAFEHEMFSSDYKVDKKLYRAVNPKLALVCGGTPDQIYRLLPNHENGMGSRCFIYMAESESEFRLMEPQEGEDPSEELIKRLGEQMKGYYHWLKTYPTQVKFTSAQWRRHQRFFQLLLDKVNVESEERRTQLVYRFGCNAIRIASIFTTLRKCEEGWEYKEVYCTDEDLERALLITEVGLEHSLIFATGMNEEGEAAHAIRHFFQLKKVLEALPEDFTTAQFEDTYRKLIAENASRSTIHRKLRKLVKHSQIERNSQGNYRKIVHNSEGVPPSVTQCHIDTAH